ncbi:nonsense-mediated mrna decay 1 [Fusarium sporotrichioides]|uniref:Nonsense-mediated mrna decay 1 n=1 Tax=Fusarium sporotrichioides TaxID=5514 RepID=A0A395SSC4_FUSSP|nr:nonsense-mediated mrna decay 1 [Fusarium sporotrichioides]
MSSEEALRYLVDFDTTLASHYNLLRELPGVGNVVTDRAGPAFMQDIFDKLTGEQKTCLTSMSNSVARLHFIPGVAGSGKTYLMEVLMLFTIFGNGLTNPPKTKILYILKNNGFSEDNDSRRLPNIIHLDCLPDEDDLAEEFSGYEIIRDALCTKGINREFSDLQPDLVIIDDASTMTTATTDPIIAHFTPKAWVFAGDVFLKPFEYDEVDGDYIDDEIKFQIDYIYPSWDQADRNQQVYWDSGIVCRTAEGTSWSWKCYDRAGPGFTQEIFDKLPGPMKDCLASMAKSFARLHFTPDVAGSGLGISDIGRWGHKRRNCLEIDCCPTVPGDVPHGSTSALHCGNGLTNPSISVLRRSANDSERAPDIIRLYPMEGELKTLYRGTIREFFGVVATTTAAPPLLLHEELHPDLIILDEAATLDEATLLILIAHFMPKAWVITGDIAQSPFYSASEWCTTFNTVGKHEGPRECCFL